MFFGSKTDYTKGIWDEATKQYIYPVRPVGFVEYLKDYNINRLQKAIIKLCQWLWDKGIPYAFGLVTTYIYNLLKPYIH